MYFRLGAEADETPLSGIVDSDLIIQRSTKITSVRLAPASTTIDVIRALLWLRGAMKLQAL